MNCARAPEPAPSPVVVVVDHDDDNRALYADAFRRDGWTVVEATDGREGLVAALSQRASLIVTDARLPFIDGITLCEVLRRDATARDLPVLIIAADPRPADRVRVAQCGDAVLVSKPAAFDAVLAESRRMVEAAPEIGAADGTSEGSAQVAAATQRTVPEDGAAAPLRRHICPSCKRPLDFESTHVGGAGRDVDRWDRLVCNGGGCGDFEYHHRTRTLRPA